MNPRILLLLIEEPRKKGQRRIVRMISKSSTAEIEL